MTVIRIQERDGGAEQENALLIFNHSVQYSIQVDDPFASTPQQEGNLEWYFEEYLTFPFTQDVRARRAAESIRHYGESLFKQVFANPRALMDYRQAAQKEGFHDLHIEIAGSSPSFHRLHWEALYDPDLQLHLALNAPMIRQNLEQQRFPATMRPAATIRVLVVVARPSGSRDVGYRTISRPLMDELEKISQPVEVTLVRPGTYQALEERLEKTTRAHGPGYYHVIHLDVHGGLLSYEAFQQGAQSNRYLYQGRFGRSDIDPYEGERAYLFLEGEGDAQADPVEASEMANLLLKHQIPMAILNACQSGKYVGEHESSLASHLIQAGVQSVLAMAYSVTVSAAELLIPVLYRELFANHPLSIALYPARQALAESKERRAFFDHKIDLEDWVLPVLYQNQEVWFERQPFTPQQETMFFQRKADRYRAPQEPSYGFVGRDVDILYIEKRLLMKRNVLLVHGMGGVGKTTLLHHLASWWQRTGLVQQVFYFGYDERAWNRQHIMRTIAQRLLGREDFALFQARSPEAQQEQLASLLRSASHLLILDNLESITGAHLAIRHTLSKTEQDRLHDLLSKLVGGKTLVLLGSRSAETWLAKGTFEENRYDLAGLDPEAASILVERILERHQVTKYRQDKDLQNLMKLLNGFPLALEVVLSNLAHQTPTQVLAALQAGDVTLKTGESEERTENILRCVDYSHSNLSPDAQQLLLCLAPFTSVIWRGRKLLNLYTKHLKEQPSLAHLPFERWDEVLREAEQWGLLSPDLNIPQIVHLQPVLTYFLRRQFSSEAKQEQRAAIETAFYELYCDLSKIFDSFITSKQAEEQQRGLLLTHFEYENLLTALRLALSKKTSVIALYCVLDHYLTRYQEHQRGQELDMLVLHSFEEISEEALTSVQRQEFAQALRKTAHRHQRLKQYEEATRRYQKALQMMENVPMEVQQHHLVQASTYSNLGMVAEAQRQWEQAERYYQQALQIFGEYNVRSAQAWIYHQLGIVAQEQYQWEQAEHYYQQALQIDIEYNDRYAQASTYHQLGRVAEAQRQWEQAKRYYQQALQIYVEYNDRYEQADAYHNLGTVAEAQRQREQAERYYQQALQIRIEYNDRYKQADTYHQLGVMALEQQQWEQAERYHQQALQIDIEYNARYEQASSYHALGTVSQAQRRWEQAERYYQQALQIFGEYNDRYKQASIYYNLGVMALEQQQWEQAGEKLLQALHIFVDYEIVTIVLEALARLWRNTRDTQLLMRVASLVGMTPEKVEELFQQLPEDPSEQTNE